MSFPSFNTGDVLTAADMNAVGMWLVKTQAVGTGVASVTVTSCFNSTFANYRIIYMGGSATTSSNLALQFGPASVGGYNANYYQIVHYSFFNGTANNNIAASNNASNFPYIGFHDSDSVRFSADIGNPNATEWTTLYNAPYITNASAGYCVGVVQNNAQFTEFTLSPSSGTLTGGTIRVYGYRN